MVICSFSTKAYRKKTHESFLSQHSFMWFFLGYIYGAIWKRKKKGLPASEEFYYGKYGKLYRFGYANSYMKKANIHSFRLWTGKQHKIEIWFHFCFTDLKVNGRNCSISYLIEWRYLFQFPGFSWNELILTWYAICNVRVINLINSVSYELIGLI